MNLDDRPPGGAPGALDRVVGYPLGAVTGRQALAIRIADTVIHTWDLAYAAMGLCTECRSVTAKPGQ